MYIMYYVHVMYVYLYLGVFQQLWGYNEVVKVMVSNVHMQEGRHVEIANTTIIGPGGEDLS